MKPNKARKCWVSFLNPTYARFLALTELYYLLKLNFIGAIASLLSFNFP
ncbi:MAG: hypothetical protein RMX35_10930 [Nostoc sp. DcaGUA01]|nr:hypothetical protein [Nostoc sp. DcaGUA01]